MGDILIKNGVIVDGTGREPFLGSVLTRNGKVAQAGVISDTINVGETIDAHGRYIVPGFIDMHSHSEMDLLVNPFAESVVHQGITTVLSFLSCGKSTGPLVGTALNTIKDYVYTRYGNQSGINVDWTTSGEFYEKLEENGIAINYVNLVGATTLRECELGSTRRSPAKHELGKMEYLAAQSLDEGAWGISTGLEYAPGSFAEKPEVIALCKVVKKYDGIYVTHMRSHSAGYLNAVMEAIDIGRQADVSVQIAHNRPSGEKNWGKSTVVLEMIEEARSNGIDVTSDNFPYLAGLTRLKELIPLWAHEGGTEQFLARLQNPETRKKLKEGMKQGNGYSMDLISDEGWKNVQIVTDFSPEYMGKDIYSLAIEKKVDPYDLAFDILIADKGRTFINIFEASWEDVDRMNVHPTTFVGSDAWAISPKGILGRGVPHPRMYGTFPRMIQRYVKEEKLLPIEKLIEKMSYLPAKKIGLRDRGCIKEGVWGDLVILDYGKIQDIGTYTDPHHFPIGIDIVIVNGTVVLREGVQTKSLPGKVLRKNQA